MKNIIFGDCYLVELPKFGDNQRGFLTSIESMKKIPFEIKRIYYIYEITKLSEIRGPHAHKEAQQIFINISGTSTCNLDNGKERKKIRLVNPNIGIYIGPRIWHYFNEFSEKVIILAIASNYYKESDYIRDYKEFINCII